MEILYEDNHFIAVNKPAGMLAQGDKTGDEHIADYIKKYIKDKYKKPGDVFLGICHRLDRPVSGVTLLARTSKALERINKIFAEREMEKTYWAISTSRPDPLEGHLTHFLLKDPDTNITKAFDTMSSRATGAKKADLDYELLAEIGENFLIKVNPLTGRPHQIRAQLAKIGCPIRGDKKYNSNRPARAGAIYLHCKSLSFMHPVKNVRITIKAPPPNEQIWNLFNHI